MALSTHNRGRPTSQVVLSALHLSKLYPNFETRFLVNKNHVSKWLKRPNLVLRPKSVGDSQIFAPSPFNRGVFMKEGMNYVCAR